MDLNFGPFGKYLLYTFYYWYITVPIAFLLLWACLHRNNKPGIRWISGIGATVLLFPMVVMVWDPGGLINNGINKPEVRPQKMLHTYILKQPETTAGIVLSAGDTVFYAMEFDMNYRKEAQLNDIDSVHLSKPARFFNLQVKDIIRVGLHNEWNVTLTHQQLVFGWPCIGDVMIGADSTFIRGTLADDYILLGYRLPKGSEVTYDSDYVNIVLPNLELLTITGRTGRPLSEEDKQQADLLKYKRP